MDIESEKAFLKAREELGDLAAMIDLFTMTFMYMSEAGAKLLGSSVDEIVGDSFFKYSSIAEDNSKESIISMLNGRTKEVHVKKTNGESILIKMKFTPTDLDTDQPYIAVKIFH